MLLFFCTFYSDALKLMSYTNIASPGFLKICNSWVTKDLSRSLQDEDDLWIEKHTVISPPLNIKNGW